MIRENFPGDAVLDVVRAASKDLIFVAPYIKTTALQRVIDSIPSSSVSLICVTRWLPEDVAARVCDLEIFDQISEYPGGKLLIHPHLHAKYYRADHRCLIGSANLTSRGLGWTTPPNVELLVELPADFNGLSEWEEGLLDAAIPATHKLREQIRIESDKLIVGGARINLPEIEGSGEDEQSVSQWVPRCPVPDRLWDVYTGQAQDIMVTGALEAAQTDLAALAVPPGLTRELFEAYVAGILRYMSMFLEIDSLAARALPDNEAHRLLASHLGGRAPHPPEEMWRIFKAWLTYFFPEKYRLEVGQEVLVKGRDISRRG